MALESIKQINKAEEDARQILRNSTQRAKAIIKEGENEGIEIYNSLISSSKKEAAKLLDEAEEQSGKEAEAMRTRGREEETFITGISEEKINAAANLVIERIVKINGNS